MSHTLWQEIGPIISYTFFCAAGVCSAFLWFQEEGFKSLTKLVGKLFFPCFIAFNLSILGVLLIGDACKIAAVLALANAIMIGLMHPRQSKGEKIATTACASFRNNSSQHQMGVEAKFGANAMPEFSLIIVIDHLVSYPMVMWLYQREHKEVKSFCQHLWRILAKLLCSPFFLSVLFGLYLWHTSWLKRPETVGLRDFLQRCANMYSGLAVFVVGLNIGMHLKVYWPKNQKQVQDLQAAAEANCASYTNKDALIGYTLWHLRWMVSVHNKICGCLAIIKALWVIVKKPLLHKLALKKMGVYPLVVLGLGLLMNALVGMNTLHRWLLALLAATSLSSSLTSINEEEGGDSHQLAEVTLVQNMWALVLIPVLYLAT